MGRSPDYIIAVLENLAISTNINAFLERQAKNPSSLDLYNFLNKKLKLEELKAAVSLKTSDRPDRRYQPLFEAAMIKLCSKIGAIIW